MARVSIVIITKNEAASIANCIKVAQLITDDIIVIDNGSTDNTPEIVQEYGCRLSREIWEGYGANKNKGAHLARYDWILSLDADEVPDMKLVYSLHTLDLSNPHIVYDIKFKSYFGKKQIRFGNWGFDHRLRLFNRNLVKWSDSRVHETLLLPKDISIVKIKGHIHHYTVNDNKECNKKSIYYAGLSASHYLSQGKKANFIRLYVSPTFDFMVNYIIRLGFLDGAEGLNIARNIYENTWLKYHYLRLYQQKKQTSIKISILNTKHIGS